MIFVYNKTRAAKGVRISTLLIITHIFRVVKKKESVKMKICAIICEYNPFHNGHLYQLRAVKQMTDSDSVVCFMSGNFVQRGEAALLGKYTRAKHAVLAGADAVVELPVVFSTSPAEIFAKGAVKLLSSVPAVNLLCFGAESGEKEDFYAAAQAMENEPPTVSAEIKRLLKSGVSYAKARAEAWKSVFPSELLLRPNNLLGVEYTRAISASGANVGIFPLKRIGSDYSDVAMHGNYSSATAIRTAVLHGEREKATEALPPFVLKDIPLYFTDYSLLLEKFALSERSAEEIRSVCDCTEGLENALKHAAEKNLPDIVQELTSKRYTASRIRRILLQNLLKISEAFIRECLSSDLYLNILAVGKNREKILRALGESEFPVLIRAGDEKKLNGTAKTCFEKNRCADEIFSLIRELRPEKKTVFH